MFITPATPRGRGRRQSGIRAAGESLPTAGEMLANLRATLDSADFAHIDEGLGWYRVAHSIARELHESHPDTVRSVRHGAGIIAALSPQTGWAENISLAHQAAAAGSADGLAHFADATGKASRILRGEDPGDVLGGRKVRSFFSNILDPDRSGPVTIDRHAVDMLCGRRGAVKDRVLERVGVYLRCTAVIRSEARRMGWRPHEVQAVAWVAWRHAHDVAARYDGEEF